MKRARSRPRGRRYRNLYRNGGPHIWYERIVCGQRFRWSTRTSNWDRAAERRDAWERLRGVGEGGPVELGHMPTFAEMADQYLVSGVAHLRATTLRDRRSYLKPGGPAQAAIGSMPMDQISRRDFVRMWEAETRRGLSFSTRRNHFNAIAAVFRYAWKHEVIEVDPCGAFRRIMAEEQRTSSGRAAAANGGRVRPIDNPDDLARFLEACEALAAEGGDFQRDSQVLTLVMLDAGLRIGEAIALRWSDVHFGTAADDLERHLVVRRSRSRDEAETEPKSGHTRRVDLSQRLWRTLKRHHLRHGRPGPDARLFPTMQQTNYAPRFFQKAVKRAALPHHSPHDLRHTFASWLLTLRGDWLGYVQQALGHSDASLTSRAYAKWLGRVHHDVMIPGPGELPPDLLARVGAPAFGGRTSRADG